MAQKAIPVIIIFAPTACGKTACAREIFGTRSLSHFKGCGEVVSADSQSAYKYLDIGTAKPTAEECAELPHHLVDVVTPDVQFGLGEWFDGAENACEEIWSRGKLPLVVGGTGFYIRNFILGLPVTPQSTPEMHAALQRRLKEEGGAALYEELQKLDPKSAEKINVHDEYRITRALEVYYLCGKPLSSFVLPSVPRKKYNFCTIILTREKEELYQRINDRVEQMFSLGLAGEVRGLVARGYTEQSPGMKAIGYSEFFIPNKSVGQIQEQIKLDSRHYAKKQYTFMRDIPGAVTVAADDFAAVEKIINNFVYTT